MAISPRETAQPADVDVRIEEPDRPGPASDIDEFAPAPGNEKNLLFSYALSNVMRILCLNFIALIQKATVL